MADKPYILVYDHGTTSIRACLMDKQGQFIASGQKQFEQFYPKPGWVEHDASELWTTTLTVTQEAFKNAGISWSDIHAIGITNQRETVVMWDKATGEPVCKAIVWQCRRTTDECNALREKPGVEDAIRQKTGLVIDPYFSGTKVQWLLNNDENVKTCLDNGNLCFGTVDSWILFKLSGKQVHVTDQSNASRTLLYNIHTKVWDDELLEILNVPKAILPEVMHSNAIFGQTDSGLTDGQSVPMAGNAGDQQAALFGQLCWEPGMAKCTFGTGAFLLKNLGQEATMSNKGLLTTIGCAADGSPAYAMEGAIFMAGAVLEWLIKSLNILDKAADADGLATSIEGNDGVYLVPAFVGLGAPYWDADARGTLVGLTQGSGRAQIVRAGLEAIAYQTKDVVESMKADTGLDLKTLRVDGGLTRSDFLMQFLADILGVEIQRSPDPELTAKGAGYLAGLGTGFFASPDDIKSLPSEWESFKPSMADSQKEACYNGWRAAVKQTLAR